MTRVGPSVCSRQKDCEPAPQAGSRPRGGGGGIRTLVRGLTPETVFETAAFNHSATPPSDELGRQASEGPPDFPSWTSSPPPSSATPPSTPRRRRPRSPISSP